MKGGEWEVKITVPEGLKINYKFCIVDDHYNIVRWEDGDNRGFVVPPVDVELAEVWRVCIVPLNIICVNCSLDKRRTVFISLIMTLCLSDIRASHPISPH